MSSAKNVVETFRDVVQDLLVPELKAVKVSVDSLRTEMKLTNEAIRSEMKLTNDAARSEMKFTSDAIRNEMKSSNEAIREEIKLTNAAIREEIKLRHESLERLIQHNDDLNRQRIQGLAEKLDIAIDIRERLSNIEARMPRQ